jgi:hypothetical protein
MADWLPLAGILSVSIVSFFISADQWPGKHEEGARGLSPSSPNISMGKICFCLLHYVFSHN